MIDKNLHRWLTVLLIAFLVIGISGVSFAGDDEDDKTIIVKTKSSDGAFLGIYPSTVSDEDREALDYKGDGVLISSIVDDGPAEEAGLESGDIIIKMDKMDIKNEKHLRKFLSGKKPGDKISLLVVRKGKEKKFKLELAERPQDTFVEIPEIPNIVMMSSGTFLGIVGKDLGEQLAEYFEVKSGILIESVEEETPADKAGIKAGDVITEIAGDKIEDMNDLRKTLRKYKPEDKVAIEVIRKGKKQKLEAVLGERPGFDKLKGSYFYNYGDAQHKYLESEEIQKVVQEALESAKVALENVELEKEMEEVRKQLEEVKKQLEEMKKEMK